MINETFHLKEGSKSVVVVRQYAGMAGKVDNCQVAIHSSLANGKFCTLVGSELFIREDWTKDKERCAAAGIPSEEQKFQSKPELAIKLIKRAVEAGADLDSFS